MLPAESGLAPGTVAGRIDGDESIEAFFLQKEVLRQFGGTSAEQLSGPVSIQIVSDASPNAQVLFDQTFDLRIVVISAEDPFFGSGIGIYDWFWFTQSFNASVGRFKTRIVNGTPIPVVIAASAKSAFEAQSPPVSPAPEFPGPVALLGYRTQSITARMPALPTRATSFTLQIAAGGVLVPLEGTWLDFKVGLLPNSDTLVPAAAVGETNAERLWFRLKAVGPGGTSIGPAIRDAYQEWFNTTLLEGYEGYRGIYTFNNQPPTVYAEAGSGYQEIGAQVSVGGQIIGRWSGPIYRCEAGAGAIIRILSDKWAPASTIRDKYTFSISYKPGSLSESAVQHPDLGKTFYLYKGSGDARLAQDRRREGFKKLASDPVVFDFAPTTLGLTRSRGLLVALGGQGGGVTIGLSHDDGISWQREEDIIADTKSLAECQDEDGTLYIVGKATATEITSEKPESEQVNQGDIVRVVLRPSSDPSKGGAYLQTERARITAAMGTVIPDKNITRLFLERGVFNLVARDGDDFRFFSSADGLQTLREVTPSATPTVTPTES